MNKLSEEEKKVIIEKDTEPPYSGKYDNFFESGIYSCKQCDAFLYRSTDKFDSGCGWPSFDDEIDGAIKRQIDSDCKRTEILCSRCDAHLGHIFVGENLTSKNIRHCVNSLSMNFINESDLKKDIIEEKILLGGGCFWCTEAVYKIINGIINVQSGYAGGDKINPTYDDVSSGQTGHAEVIEITYNKTIISLEKILDIFFDSHDPTTLNRQGNDIGSQYRSCIFIYKDDDSSNKIEIINKFISKINPSFSDKIVTEVSIINKENFYHAEDFHKDYYKNHPENNYCQIMIAPKIEKISKKYKKS